MSKPDDVQAHPLKWPAGWPRTRNPERTSRYSVTMARARDDLLHSLEILGAKNVVISSNIALRLDGLPRAGQSDYPKDAGVAVYWSMTVRNGVGKRQVPQVMACDQWDSVRSNLRAIGLAVDGMRAIQRSGASQILERAYTGFAALPASTITPPPPKPWWEVLDVPQTCSIVLAESRYRRLAGERHPDTGGDHARMVELNRAISEAREDLGQ